MRLRAPRFYHQSAHRKRMLVREAKSKPCVDCLTEGRRADWPWPAMTLDHTGRKTMEFSAGGMINIRMNSTEGGKPSYLSFSVNEIIHELTLCEPICGGHHYLRTRARKLMICPDEDEGEDEGDDEIALF